MSENDEIANDIRKTEKTGRSEYKRTQADLTDVRFINENGNMHVVYAW